MTVAEARHIAQRYSNGKTEEEQFMYTEALGFLIDATKDPCYMMELGGFYYEEKKFDLALKYYEMAAMSGYEDAYVCLGYVWYYGRTGTVDYEKAFKYYKLAADKGDLVCEYKLADMYKNGYYVEKDYDRYVSIIEELYPKVVNAKYVNEPLPEIFTRLAAIRAQQGRTKEAVDLYLTAKDFLGQRIRYNAFFGNLSIMKWLVNDLYKLIDFDVNDFDLFDLYYLLKRPVKVCFDYGKTRYKIEAVEEDGEVIINFDGKWYRTIDDFFAKACIDGDRLPVISGDMYLFEVVKE